MLNKPIIRSILDNDLYKFLMQYGVATLYPRAMARHQFFNRGKTIFAKDMASQVREQVVMMQNLALTKEEKLWLQETCGWFMPPVYLDLLEAYRYDPSEVHITDEGPYNFDMRIEGPWYREILWEVPLMAIVSELHFQNIPQNMEDFCERTIDKGRRLRKAGAYHADFGTRRRFSYDAQETAVGALLTAEQELNPAKNFFVGTSNVYLAKQHNIKPIGTQAHEWFQFHAAKYGVRMANHMSLGRWVDVYNGNLGIALTDTFTTQNFWESFDTFYGKLFDGLRHDSGDPIEFGEAAIKHYKKLRIDPLSKTIVFSDGLNTDTAITLAEYFQDRIKISFGIGTHFTNDFPGITPLNIVIKMVAALPEGFKRWLHTIKLSDVPGKETGDPDTRELYKRELCLAA
jgi:nicotinate phosphoribosyltransferase